MLGARPLTVNGPTGTELRRASSKSEYEWPGIHYPPAMRARVALLAVAILVTACGPKVIRQEVVRSDLVHVEIRRTEVKGVLVPRGFDQPAIIADVRLAHILASFSHTSGEGTARPTIRTEHVYELAEGLSKAFALAGPDAEIVAAAHARDRRLSIFTEERVTSLRASLQTDLLVFEFFAIEEIVPRESGKAHENRRYEIPLEIPSGRAAFRLVPGDAQLQHGARGIAVEWRDPYYARPVSLRARFGQTRRRTILMEMTEEELANATLELPPPEELSDAQLRALDELEAARRSGFVTEVEYRRRHRLIIQDRLEESGYPRELP